jgi:hypothetical protein
LELSLLLQLRNNGRELRVLVRICMRSIIYVAK